MRRLALLGALAHVHRFLHPAVRVDKIVEAAIASRLLAHSESIAAKPILLRLVSIGVPVIELSFGEMMIY